MDSSAQPDRFSNLPDVLLVLIISCLPFKDCIKTSVLSKRWRYLCLQTTNVSFKESDFVNPTLDETSWISARHAFIDYACRWVDRIQDQDVESFEISISRPSIYMSVIESLIAFAVGKQVKKLVLDFSKPIWKTTRDVHEYLDLTVEVPESVYNLTSLESLTVNACKMFDPLRFKDLGIFKSLSLGYMRLENVESLLSKASRLESLSINECWGLDFKKIVGNMREVAFKNCDFPLMSFSFDLPKVDIFKYSGHIFCLDFEKENMEIKEVYLDFGVEGEYEDEPTESHIAQGEIVCNLLNELRSAKTLTVCPYLLQVIQECHDPDFMLRDLEAQHLVLRTKLHPKEFMGIRILFDKCLVLQTLTFDYVPPNPSFCSETISYRGIYPQTHWLQNISYKCLIKTLKAVVFKKFTGSLDQLHMLNFLVRTGSGWVRSLERVDLYMPNGLEKDEMRVAREGATMLQRKTNLARIILHSPCDANGDTRPIRIPKPNAKYHHD
ncbi:hypothetical protein EUTSA_v10015702mg [Eutrema salsugineum]|uniref:F-box domain-containing protein n=1 Tax=Eutrema salsugineum TaxID=72664 RepID=V4LT09_EUTSA|nr:putative F-box/LRR-repeat protein At1g56400 [Eutrema salsugineum]ESQ42983.1 hypothetical protein EUTSA_v10015702mg [Eutrema salsugineum]